MPSLRLADRLRRLSVAVTDGWAIPNHQSQLADGLVEAADELDRLSDENAQVRALYDQHLVRHAAQLDRLSARAAELEAVLREVEWVEADEGSGSYRCPICRGQKPGPLPMELGHAPDCRLARLLSPLPEEG